MHVCKHVQLIMQKTKSNDECSEAAIQTNIILLKIVNTKFIINSLLSWLTE